VLSRYICEHVPSLYTSRAENLRLQSPRGALLVGWEQQFRICRADRPNRAH
jgi:hypothetical protein